MAQKINVELVDDIDGGVADETIVFGLDGKQYQIDLSADNGKALRETLAEWIGAARKAGTTAAKRNVRKPANTETTLIRTWAAENGLKVAERGRIPQQILDQYRAANSAA